MCGSETSPRGWLSQVPDLGDNGVGGLSGVCGVLPSSDSALLGKLGCSGTVGVLTGIMGGLMGIVPKISPPDGCRRLGLEDGIRQIVATPGVITAVGLEGRPAVEAGRLDWNTRQ